MSKLKVVFQSPARSAGFTILTMLVWSLIGALPVFAGAAASPSEGDIIQAVLAANSRMTAAANRLDTDAFFACIVDSDESRIIQDGKLFKTRAEAMTAVRQGSQKIVKIERRFIDPHVTVLAPGVALLTTEGTTSATLQEGRTINSRFAVSLVFVLRDGEWRLFHGHYSLPNPSP